jgi:hypothetical protein
VTEAALWIWRAGALAAWLVLAGAVAHMVVHLLRAPRHRPHH